MTVISLRTGDSLDVLKATADASCAGVLTDPPYGIEYLGTSWDVFDATWRRDPQKAMQNYQAWCEVWARECFRILNPGCEIITFSATRSFHRMATCLENVGFKVERFAAWGYGSGFPHSMSISKSIDALLMTGKSNSVALSKNEKERPVVGHVQRVVTTGRAAANGLGSHGVKANMERWLNNETRDIAVTASVTPEAKRFDGYGTSMKQAWEPFLVGRKP